MTLRHAALGAGLALGLATGAAQAAPIEFYPTGSLETYSITTTGIYTLLAFGAQGGDVLGGKGAEVQGDFLLRSGQVLTFAIGTQGQIPSYQVGSGGGGGTFIVLGATTPLIVAGGGGGGDVGSNVRGQGGLAETGPSVGAGGADDEGGAGGGGFYGDGQDSRLFGSGGAGGGKGYPDLTGGQGGAFGSGGGYGGGGGSSYGTAGGGGGYNGGDAGHSGRGGTSYLASSVLDNSNLLRLSGVRSENGFVSIDFVKAVSVVPLPGSAPMFGAALLGLAGLGYAAQRKKTAEAI